MIYPSIICHLSGARGSVSEGKIRSPSPQPPLPARLGGKPRDIISPACPGSGPRSSLSLIYQNHINWLLLMRRSNHSVLTCTTELLTPSLREHLATCWKKLISPSNTHSLILLVTTQSNRERPLNHQLSDVEVLIFTPAASHSFSNHPSASWRSPPDEAKRTTSVSKGRDHCNRKFRKAGKKVKQMFFFQETGKRYKTQTDTKKSSGHWRL